MESNNQKLNEGIKTIEQDLVAAESVIQQLDRIIYTADQNTTRQNYRAIACQLIELSKSYREIKNLLNTYNNQDIQETIN